MERIVLVASSQSASLCVGRERRKEDCRPACSVGSQCLSQERQSRGEKCCQKKLYLCCLFLPRSSEAQEHISDKSFSKAGEGRRP